MEGWLDLNEYSNKYRVSISTLRRRIKSGDVEHQFSDGKYLIFDAPVPPPASSRIAPQSDMQETKPEVAPPNEGPSQQTELEAVPSVGRASVASPVVAEIKRAYALILQEKEEQILQLKDEVTDLKTLVAVLEHEVQRLKDRDPFEVSHPLSHDTLSFMDDGVELDLEL